jgi:hypothetical protein
VALSLLWAYPLIYVLAGCGGGGGGTTTPSATPDPRSGNWEGVAQPEIAGNPGDVVQFTVTNDGKVPSATLKIRAKWTTSPFNALPATEDSCEIVLTSEGTSAIDSLNTAAIVVTNPRIRAHWNTSNTMHITIHAAFASSNKVVGNIYSYTYDAESVAAYCGGKKPGFTHAVIIHDHDWSGQKK